MMLSLFINFQGITSILRRGKLGNRFTLISLGVVLLIPTAAQSRQSLVTSSCQAGVDFWTREYSDQSSENTRTDNEKQALIIRPDFSLTSTGFHNSFKLQYAPSFKHNLIDNESELDHSARVNGSVSISRYWTVTAGNQFSYGDNSLQSATSVLNGSATENEATTDFQEEDQGEELALSESRKRHLSNKTLLGTKYMYSRDSSISISYNYQALRYDRAEGIPDDSGNDHDKHDLSASLSHRINQAWKTALKLNLTKGFFPQESELDQDDESVTETEDQELTNRDLEQRGATLQLTWLPSQRQSWSVLYSYKGTTYQNDNNRNSAINGLTLSSQYALDRHTSLSLGGGLSQSGIEGQETRYDYNAVVSIKKKFNNSSVDISIKKQYDTINFSGSDQYGLLDSYDARLQCSYVFSKELSFSVYGAYEFEENLTPQGDLVPEGDTTSETTAESTDNDSPYTTTRHQAGGSLKYDFLQKLSASINYSWSKQVGDLSEDSFHDHRVSIHVIWSNDLMRW